jgi:ribokinase
MSIAVIGSINTDLVIQVPRFAQKNETILGKGSYQVSQGGKGANQAVAAAAAGLAVSMVGKIGTDAFGDGAIESLVAAGVNCDYVIRSNDHATGLATIFLDPEGNNSITVAPGANEDLTAIDIRAASEIIGAARIVMLQLEIPLEAVRATVELANKSGAVVILDPAPAPDEALEFLHLVDYLTPNEVEAESLTGISIEAEDGPQRIAAALLDMGVGNVALTMGARGSYIANAEMSLHIEAREVSVVDTTGAGDAFSGYLGTALAKGLEFIEAAKIASAAATLSVTRPGARSDQPDWDSVIGFMQS